jgi:BON domain-containing protein
LRAAQAMSERGARTRNQEDRMARYDQGFRGVGGGRPRGGAGWGAGHGGGFEGDPGAYDDGFRIYRGVRHGRRGEPAGGSGGGYPGGPAGSGGWVGPRGGSTFGGGNRGYGGQGGRGGWGGGYDAYDRGIYGAEHPGYGGYPGGPVRGEYYGGGGYGAGRPSQGRGYDQGYARQPFLPEEAYRRHPEYDQPPGRREWEAYQHEPGEELSDDEVREAVRRRMRGDAWLDPARIQVEVEDGVVTLTGEVDDFLEARYAWDDAWETAGVRGVVNNLTVRADQPHDLHGDMVPQSSGERTELEPGGAVLWREPGGG